MLYFSSSQLMYIWVPFNFAASDILGIFLWAPDARISVRHLSQGGMWDHRTCAASIRHCQAISLSSRTSLPPRSYPQTEAPAHNWCYQSCSQSGGVSWYLTVVLNLHFPRGRWHEHLDTDFGHLDFLLGEGPLLVVRHFPIGLFGLSYPFVETLERNLLLDDFIYYFTFN